MPTSVNLFKPIVGDNNIVTTGENYEKFKVTLQSMYYEADTAFTSEIAALSTEGWAYYYGQLPSSAVTGGSKYVDRTVFETVNGTVQDLLNVFTNGEEYAIIKTTSGDVGATQYINKVIQTEEGYRTFHDVFKEACVARNSYLKYYWEDKIETVEEDFRDMSQDELEAYLDSKKRDVDDTTPQVLESVEDEYGLLTGVLEYTVDKSGVRLDYVPFEEVIFDPQSQTLKDTSYLCHRTEKTKEELMDMGYTEKMLEGAGATDRWLYNRAYRQARNGNRFPSMTPHTFTDDTQKSYTLCEHYIRTSLLSKGKLKRVKLYQVFTVGQYHIMEINEVDRIPLCTATPLPVPGGIYGESVVDITKDIQDVKSAIMRGYIDNIHNANHGGVTALKGNYNKRDLIDNRPRRIVEVDVPNAVVPFPYNPLPQGIDNLLAHMDKAQEKRSGVTEISQGLNADVLSNDNAFATVAMVMNAAQNRLKMVARNVAQTFMKDLMIGIYHLARKNDKRPLMMNNFMGSSQVIPYWQWPESAEVHVEVAIGEGEKQAYAQKLVQALTMLAQAPMLAGSAFTAGNAHYLAYNAMKYMGIRDLPLALTPMGQVQPPQPDPMAQKAKELELAKMEAEVMEKQANAQSKQMDGQAKQAEVQISMQRFGFEQQQAADQFKLQVQDYMSKGQREADRTAKENLEAQTKLMQAKFEAGLKSTDLQAKQEMEADKMFLEQQKIKLDNQLKAKELQIKQMELQIKAMELQQKGQVEAAKLSVQKETSDKQLDLSREQTAVQASMQQKQLESSERQADKAHVVNMANNEANRNAQKDMEKSKAEAPKKEDKNKKPVDKSKDSK